MQHVSDFEGAALICTALHCTALQEKQMRLVATTVKNRNTAAKVHCTALHCTSLHSAQEGGWMPVETWREEMRALRLFSSRQARRLLTLVSCEQQASPGLSPTHIVLHCTALHCTALHCKEESCRYLSYLAS
jgi:hypothetical protein